MDKQEPKIISGGLSNDELYTWLTYKVERMTTLMALETEKASLEERLLAVNGQIANVGLQSQIEIFATTVDPIHPPGSQEN
jgi:hypothetical protein